LVENRAFFIPLALDAPLGGGRPRRSIAMQFGMKKTRMVGLLDGAKTLRIYWRHWPFRQNTCVWQTDKQTDGRADILPQHSLRYVCASRGKIIKIS